MAAAVAMPVIASGGVTTLDDVKRLQENGLAGCIIGRALYEGQLNLREVVAKFREDRMISDVIFAVPVHGVRVSPRGTAPGSTRGGTHSIHSPELLWHIMWTTFAPWHWSGTKSPARLRWPTPCSSRPRRSSAAAASDDGTSVSDFDEEENKHKYSIDSSVLHLEYHGKRVYLLDTPGKPDFVGQALCGLNAVDTAIIVISATAGIEVNTRRMFNEAGKRGLARMIVINKLDSDNIHFDELLEQHPRHLRQGLRPVQRADQRRSRASAASSAC